MKYQKEVEFERIRKKKMQEDYSKFLKKQMNEKLDKSDQVDKAERQFASDLLSGELNSLENKAMVR